MTDELKRKMKKQIKEEIRKLPVNAHGTKVVNGKLQKKDWVSDNYINLIIRLITQAVEEERKSLKEHGNGMPDPTNKMGDSFNMGYIVGYKTACAEFDSKIDKLTK